ncbi:hypothetical protein PIB30_114444, partial [Stylosanthes scabra]|nr:hypothetical protein [Stylosanthes scabra]
GEDHGGKKGTTETGASFWKGRGQRKNRGGRERPLKQGLLFGREEEGFSLDLNIRLQARIQEFCEFNRDCSCTTTFYSCTDGYYRRLRSTGCTDGLAVGKGD